MSYLQSGVWPDGVLDSDAPPAARYVRAISVRLGEALIEQSVVEVANRAGIARSTIYDLLAGTTWPDVVTLAHLEDVLEVRLWPELGATD